MQSHDRRSKILRKWNDDNGGNGQPTLMQSSNKAEGERWCLNSIDVGKHGKKRLRTPFTKHGIVKESSTRIAVNCTKYKPFTLHWSEIIILYLMNAYPLNIVNMTEYAIEKNIIILINRIRKADIYTVYVGVCC